MEAYLAAKKRYFTELLPGSKKLKPTAIINVDDSAGSEIARGLGEAKITYGQKNADLVFKILKMNFASTEFEASYRGQTVKVNFPMSGLHNIYNACAAMAAGLSRGLTMEKIMQALEGFDGVPGRLQQVRNSKNVYVFVDYAHSPDALENVLSSLQKVRGSAAANNQIWTIFGCGGDRDSGKRPQMASIAERLSDQVMVTSDNPRTEDPLKIIEGIVSGFIKKDHQIEIDRKLAIQKVLAQAKAGDVVLIAGKGHEDYQIIGEKKYPFSDAQVVKEYYGVNK
jgi:UDP-N-acetylmuramoyl-L-alanyl-D-glutamate--2,6-diaminopimelate ligase